MPADRLPWNSGFPRLPRPVHSGMRAHADAFDALSAFVRAKGRNCTFGDHWHLSSEGTPLLRRARSLPALNNSSSTAASRASGIPYRRPGQHCAYASSPGFFSRVRPKRSAAGAQQCSRAPLLLAVRQTARQRRVGGGRRMRPQAARHRRAAPRSPRPRSARRAAAADRLPRWRSQRPLYSNSLIARSETAVCMSRLGTHRDAGRLQPRRATS